LNVLDDMNFYAPMALGPAVVGSTGQTVYFGTDRLYRSINQGDAMTVVSGPFFPGGVVPDPDALPPGVPSTAQTNTPVSCIGISPTNDAVRIVGMNNGHVFATITGTAVAAPMVDVTDMTNMPATGSTASVPFPGKYIGRAIIDPNNPNTAYVVYNGNAIPGKHVWKGNLTGFPLVTWTAIDGTGATGLPDISVNAFVVDPRNSQHLYAGTDRGVYNSIDGGATWNRYGTGLPNVQVFDLAIQDGFRLLRAATHGRGYYEIPTVIQPVLATSAVSVKTQGGTDYPINLPFSGPAGIECRTGPVTGNHQVAISFGAPVTFSSAAVTTGTGTVSSTPGNGTNTVTVNLSGVSNAQTITITLFNVNNGVNTSSVGVRMGVLLGDVNANGSVTGSDVNDAKAQVGVDLSLSNFRSDINTTGFVSGSDVNLTKAQVGTSLP
jgi:hypothetical protein